MIYPYRWLIEAGTTAGPYHLSNGEENQDVFGIKRVKNSIILVVADGAGSLSLSKEGAQIASTMGIFSAEQQLQSDEEIPISEIVENSIKIAKDFLDNDPRRKLLGCTYGLGILTEKSICIGLVGDCFSVLHYSDHHELFENEQNSEYANITELLTSENAKIKILEKENTEDFRGITLSTDGLKFMSVNQSKPVHGFWEPIVSMSEENRFHPEDFLDFVKDRLVDDSTMVIAVKRKD